MLARPLRTATFGALRLRPRRLDTPSLCSLRLARLHRGSFASRLLALLLVALALCSLRLARLHRGSFASRLLPPLLVALTLRAFRLAPLTRRRLALRLLPLLVTALALRAFRLARADAGLLATWLPLLIRAFERCPQLQLPTGLLPTLVEALPLGCGLLSRGQSAAGCARRVIKEPALLARTQRLQLGRPG